MSFIERASEAIHTAGGRMTPQRQTIIELLASANERLDADALYQLARQQDQNINLATVYRTLRTLEEANLIREQYISPDHDRKYYTLTAETFHFTCRKCHRVIPFTSGIVDALKQQLKADLHVSALNICMCVDGLCADCLAEEQAAEATAKEPEMMRTLDQLTPGQKARVKKVGGQGAVRRRLMDMGMVNGVEVELLKAAPLGDPLEYRLRGYLLSLRKAEAQVIEID